MPTHVCSGATLECSFGQAPSTLVVLPGNQLTTSYMPAASITDHTPMVNIMPFGMCSSVSNPAVASATSAAMGVLTPTPCVPATTAPWVPGAPTVLLGNLPVLNDTSTLMCNWGGVISVVRSGQTTEKVP